MNDGVLFKRQLTMLCDFDNVKVLMCSSELIGEIAHDFTSVIPVAGLSPENSVRFFIERTTREFSEGEVLDLILERPTEEIWNLFPYDLPPVASAHELTPKQKAEMKGYL